MINCLLYINKIIFLFIIFFSSHLNTSQADNAKIILKINDQIITNQDIINEQKFLIVFNQNLKNLDSEKMYNVYTKMDWRNKLEVNHQVQYH